MLPVFSLGFFIGAIALYFLPTIIAVARNVDKRVGPILVNIFFGWTIVGWLIALIWSCTAENTFQARMREMAYARMATMEVLNPPTGPGAAYYAGRTIGKVFHRDDEPPPSILS